MITPQYELVLDGVSLSSPGAWDFLGKLNPLDVIRQYLTDRHERRKDKEYREAHENRKLYLENKLLEKGGMHLTPEAPTYSMRAHGGLPADAGGV